MGNTAIEKLMDSTRKKKLLVFCGAGVSVLPPSNSPSWWDIYKSASAALLQRFKEGFPTYDKVLDIEQLLAPLSTQQVADLIITEFAGETFVELLKVVDVADPNENHRHLASLTANGNLAGVITTNFDTLLERAASCRETAYAVVTSEIGIDKSAFPDRTPLIKLHGTSIDARHLVETLRRKARYVSPKITEMWGKIIPGSDLLVIGYSGADLEFGAARGFFEAFLSAGGNIFWLHRPNSSPKLPEPFAKGVIYIEGVLPDLLRTVAEEMQLADFATPNTDRDAHAALKREMEAWSAQLYIGRWSAASFLLSLASRAKREEQNSELIDFLLKQARSEVEKLEDSAGLSAEDVALAVFLGNASVKALEKGDPEGAAAISIAAIAIHHGINDILAAPTNKSSLQERRKNLSNVWNNLGLSLLFLDQNPKAVEAFTRGMVYAYLSGDAASFLISLFNVLCYDIGIKNVRTALFLAESGIRLADRIGAPQSSVELRMTAFMYHNDRNEIWSAWKVLNEAEKIANASGYISHQENIAALKGLLLLRQGRIEEGLTVITNAIGDDKQTLQYSKAIEYLSMYLEFLGVSKPGIIMLKKSNLPALIAEIKGRIAVAKSGSVLPFEGRHCAISTSSGVDELSSDLLFNLGAFEFQSNGHKAVSLGVALAHQMLHTDHARDALWSAENVLARPGVSGIDLGTAHTLAATAKAKIGFVEDVATHLAAAKQVFDAYLQPIPPQYADTGLWHAIQSGDINAAGQWAGILGKALADGNNTPAISVIVETIRTWGTPMEGVNRAFCEALNSAGTPTPPQPTPASKPRPYRRFTGIAARQADEETTKAIYKVKGLLANEDYDGAIASIESILRDRSRSIPQHQLDIILALQVDILKEKMSPEELDAAFDERRMELVANLHVTSLTTLETLLASSFLSDGREDLAKELLEQRDFISEFSPDLPAKVGLHLIETVIWDSSPLPNGNSKEMILALNRYYGLVDELDSSLMALGALKHSIIDEAHDFAAAFQNMREAEDHDAFSSAVSEVLTLLRKNGKLDRAMVGRIRSERGRLALRMQAFEEAQRQFQRAQRSFSSVGASRNVSMTLRHVPCEFREAFIRSQPSWVD